MILDSLRGFALLGICLANFPEFGLWTFLSSEAHACMESAGVDRVVRFLLYLLVDAKFYGIFSILFGIGFSLILSHAAERGQRGVGLFYRRMLVLLCIGCCHLLFVWNGDILVLYALVGMLLPLLRRLSGHALLWMAGVCLVVPVLIDAWQEGTGVSLSAPVYDAWWQVAAANGITQDNFATWLRDSQSYPEMFSFLKQGAVERMYEFVDGHRLLKVLGLFLIGYQIGRSRLYARLEELGGALRKCCWWGLLTGLPTSVLYAMSATQGHPWGLTVHSLLYTVSALPMTLAYISGCCVLYLHRPRHWTFRLLASNGRMALSNYIGQSLVGIAIYYGIGLGLGTAMGLAQIELVALGVYGLQVLLSLLWMSRFRFGPLEWLWRMLTYGQRLPLKR